MTLVKFQIEIDKEPIQIREFERDEIMMESPFSGIKYTFRTLLYGDKQLYDWEGHKIKNIKKLKTKVFLLTDKDELIEFRLKK